MNQNNYTHYDNLNNNSKNSYIDSIRYDYIKNIDDDEDDDDYENESDFDYKDDDDEQMTKIKQQQLQQQNGEEPDDDIADEYFKEAEFSVRNKLKKRNDVQSVSSSLSDDDQDHNEKSHDSGKSQFYVPTPSSLTLPPPPVPPKPTSSSSSLSLPQQHLEEPYIQDYSTRFTKLYENEKIIDNLNSITCSYSSTILHSKSLEETITDEIEIKGKLFLTQFQLVFLPNSTPTDQRLADLEENHLCLFSIKNEPYSFAIPLSFIYELRTCIYSFI